MSIIGDVLKAFRAAPSSPVDVAAAGRAAVAEAVRLWEMDVVDPKRTDRSANGDRCRSVIDGMIRGSDGAGWTWEHPYAGDGASFQWCGAFVARCWSAAIPIAARRRYFPSTYRLDRWARYHPVDERDRNARLRGAPDRLLAVLDDRSTGLSAGVVPQAGDILLVGPVPHGHVMGWGAHVALVESYDASSRQVATIEGNATGRGPRGNYRQGIVRSMRPIGLGSGEPRTAYHVRRLIRPAPGDLTGG